MMWLFNEIDCTFIRQVVIPGRNGICAPAIPAIQILQWNVSLNWTLLKELRQQCQGPFASLCSKTIVPVHTEYMSRVTSSSSMFRLQ